MPNYHVTNYTNPTRRGRSLGAVSGIQPIRPQTINGLKLWHAVRRETAYVNSDPISTLNDWSGNGNKATQTLTARPTYTTAGGPNSQPFALFDTSNDTMNFDSAITLNKDYTIIVVAARTGAGIVGIVCGASPYYWGFDATNLYHNVDGGVYAVAATTVTTSTYYLLALRRSAGGASFYQNGAAVYSTGTLGNNAFSPGSYVTFTGGSIITAGMNLCECLIYDSNISTNDLNGLFAYLNGVYALY